MEYSDEECNAKAEAAQREWAYNELCEEVDQLRDEAKDLRSAIERRDEIIDGLKSEVERLRGGATDFRSQSRIAIAGQLANSNAPIQQAEMSKAIKNLDQLTSIRIEENHGD